MLTKMDNMGMILTPNVELGVKMRKWKMKKVKRSVMKKKKLKLSLWLAVPKQRTNLKKTS